MRLIRLLKLLGKYAIPYISGIIIMTVSIKLFDVVRAFLVKDVFDVVLGKDGSLSGLVIKNTAVGVICLIIYVVASYLYKVESKRGDKILRFKVFQKILKLPMKYFEDNHSGSLISRYFYDTDKASDIYGSRLRRFTAPIISVIVYLVPMFVLNLPLTLCLLAANGAMLICTTYFYGKIKKIRAKISSANEEMTSQLNNIMAGIAEIKIFGIGRKIADECSQISNKFCEKEIISGKVSAQSETVNTFFDFLCYLVFLFLGIVFVAKGIASISAVAAIYTMYSKFSSQFMLMCVYFPELAGCIVSAERLFVLFDEAEERTGCKRLCDNNSNGKFVVEFKDVYFSYGDRKVLDGVSFGIERNKMTAVAGVSGKGKSTAGKLLMGFYKTAGGSIYIDGDNIENMEIAKLRDKIAYVPQNPYIFNVSVRENISYGSKNAADEDIIKAAKLANAHDFIMNREKGYETLAGERGCNFSGGEKQRIAIARAILKNAQIFLFDEATSALDTVNEKAVIENIRKNRTLIMIAHRENVIECADKVIKL